jgi:hypothetical protein
VSDKQRLRRIEDALHDNVMHLGGNMRGSVGYMPGPRVSVETEDLAWLLNQVKAKQ